jgi:hypothetical protein
MRIRFDKFKKLEFPDRAGEHQRARETASLLRELGDNYEHYHNHLAEELARIGKRPVREDYPSEDAYLEAWTYVQELVLAEALLRNCHFHRRGERSLDSAQRPDDPPLVKDDRLVGLDT